MRKSICCLTIISILLLIGLFNRNIPEKHFTLNNYQELKIEGTKQDLKSDNEAIEHVQLVFIVACLIFTAISICTFTKHIVEKSRKIIRELKFRKQLPRGSLV